MTEYADPDLDADTPVDLETFAPDPGAPDPGAPEPPVPPAPYPSGAGGGGAGGRGSVAAIAAGLVVLALVVGFAVTTVVLNTRDTAPTESASGPTPTTLPSDRDETVLGGLILRQSDVPAGNTVRLIPNGADTTQPTLDLCNGTFPSELQRTARRQVALVDSVPSLQMSTEAVLYNKSAVGDQAFRELQSVAEKCPSTPVASPFDGNIATTTFRAAPDGAWPRTPGVERLAYDFESKDAATGETSHSIAVYLRRGRVLMGVYFAQPEGKQTAVDGHTTVAEIVAVFEARMAQVSDRVAEGTP